MRRVLGATLLGALMVGIPSAAAGTRFTAAASARLFTDGTVFAVAAARDKTYVGGNFTLIGPPAGSWVGVDAAGSPVPGRPILDGTVVDAVRDGRGGWFVAGTIRAVGSVERAARVVHLRANGALDPSWRVSVHGSVRALARRGGTLFLGGAFDRVGGKPRAALVAVSVARGRVLPWRLRGAASTRVGKRVTAGAVLTMTLSRTGGTLYVAGDFDRIGGRKRNGVAGVGVANGRVTQWNPAPSGGAVSAIATASRGGTVYLGGDFHRIGGRARATLAAVDGRRGRSLSFDVHPPRYAPVYAIAATASALYVAGDFSSLGGKSRHLVAAVDPRSGAVTDWDPSVTGDEVDAVAVGPGGAVCVGGDFSEVDGQRRDRLAAVDPRTGAVTGWDPATLGDIAVIATAGQTVFVGGDIGSVGATRRPGLAALRPDGSIVDWDPPLTGVVRALALSPEGSRLYVGGAFTPGDAPAQRNLAVVDVASGGLHAFGGGTSAGVWTIAPTADGTRVYIGGAFVTVAGKRRTRLAALDPASGEVQAWNSGGNDLVRVLIPTDDVLYVGGDFTSAGGLPRARLAKLDPTTGAAFGWNAEPDDSVWALALRGDTVFVGGEFGQIGGRTRNGLAALDVESGDATSWDPSADDTVRAVRLSRDGGRLYAAGAFEKMGRASRGYAEFSTGDGSLTGWSPVTAFDGYAIDTGFDGSPLVIGGDGGVDVFR
jgi:hypothetical protein